MWFNKEFLLLYETYKLLLFIPKFDSSPVNSNWAKTKQQDEHVNARMPLSTRTDWCFLPQDSKQ